jgi:hypothetical protein
VWRSFTPAILLFASLGACGCGEAYRPVSPGRTGYLSDRAIEIDVEMELSSENELFAVEAALESGGTPLFLDRAHVKSADAGGGRVRTHVTSFAREEELLELDSTIGAYPRSARPRFRLPDDEARASAPAYGRLAEDGVLTVSALFGEMAKDGLAPDDAAYWSLAAFSLDLERHGYALDANVTGYRRYRKGEGELAVQIAVYGPELLRVGHDDEGAIVLRHAIAESDIVYVDEHAFQKGLEVLADPAAYDPARYRILVLDTCYSYSLYTRWVLDAASPGSTHVVNTDGRVVTGSVESFGAMLHAVVAEVGAPTFRSRTWLSLVGEMNDLAAARAGRRRDVPDERLRPAEVYGVSGVW